MHLEIELGARPVLSALVLERGGTLVMMMMIAPAGRGMSHGGLVTPCGAC